MQTVVQNLMCSRNKAANATYKPLLLHVHLLHSCQQASQRCQHDHPMLQNVLVESRAK